MKKLTRKQRILNYLKRYGTINHMDAEMKCGTSRLSAYIFNLRKHYQIETIMVKHKNSFGDTSRVAQYKLIS